MSPVFLDSMDSNGQQISIRASRKSKHKPSARLVSSKQSDPVIAMPAAKHMVPQRVFLYMQLKKIINMPVVAYPLELHLHHVKQTLQKMSEHYTNETVIYQHEFEKEGPAFAMGVMQDNIEDMNTFSDNPLIVTLYQRIPRHRKNQLVKVDKVRSEASDTILGEQAAVPEDYPGEDGEEGDEYVEESLEFLSQGHCDLLQLFQTKRFMSNISIMLYPEYYRSLQTATSQKTSPTSEWHMYSIIPILKNFHFTNLIFITLESIYNAPEELHDRAEHLGLSISLRATKPNLDLEYKVLPWCTFYGFGSQVISDQSLIVVWENIKRDMLGKRPFGVSNNQMDTNMRINLHRLFRRLLKTKGVDFRLDEIDPMLDSALINNSLHRFILNKEMRHTLETAVVYNEYELLLQLYNEIPTNVMYEGVINLSVFANPEVNACRFASVLYPVNRKTRKTHRLTQSPSFERPMFAIVNLCFFQPLMNRLEALDTYNENPLKVSNLRRCKPMEMPVEQDNLSDIVKELYRNFDEHIRELISFIVKNDVSSIEERRNYFCCNLSNLKNLLVKICGSDFNIRMPTKSNIEFREMLTHMYKELMERIEGLLTSCSWDGLSHCVLNQESDQVRMRRLLEEYRNMCITGDCVLAKQLYTDLRTDCKNKLLLDYYMFLNAVENLNFEQAAKYLANQREKNWEGEHFVSLLKLYVDYKMELMLEYEEEMEFTGEAFSNMIDQLRTFANHNNLDREAWILLYCIYKNKNYLPGMEYTRWKYENLYEVPAKAMPLAPRSIYETYLLQDIDLDDKSIHIVKFYAAFKTFAQLGAYQFAETIFDEISTELPPIQAYLVKTTLKMLQGEVDHHFGLLKFPTDNSKNGKKMRYYQAHVNGNVEYTRRRYNEAIKCFKDLLSIDLTDTDTLKLFNLSLMRLGRLCFERGEYEISMKAYEMCILKTEKNFLANYGMGLSLYYLNRLEEAIEYLARSTENDIFLPDSWGFLATINLRLGRNKTALNCWKIAKMYPEIPLNNRIYIELEKIKYSTVCLLVEDDCKPK